jgi:hypothetical protein
MLKMNRIEKRELDDEQIATIYKVEDVFKFSIDDFFNINGIVKNMY